MDKEKTNKLDLADGPILILGLLIIILYLLSKVTWSQVNWQICLNFVSILAWPLTALVALFTLRQPLTSLINRVNQIHAGQYGVNLDPSDQAKDAEEIAGPELGSNSRVEESQNEEPTNEIVPNNTSLTEARKELDFERIYRILYGTQLRALERLKAFGMVSANDFLDLLQEHQKLLQASSYPNVIQLMTVPASLGLLEYDSQNQEYKLTEKGNDLLDYMGQNRMTTAYKPF